MDLFIFILFQSLIEYAAGQNNSTFGNGTSLNDTFIDLTPLPFDNITETTTAAVDLITSTRSTAGTTQAPQSAALQETTSSDVSDFTVSMFCLTLSFLTM